MKKAIFLIAWLVLLFIVSPSVAADEEILKQKIVRNFEKLLDNSRIEEQTLDITTRSLAGPMLYRQVVNSVVYIITADGIRMGSGVIISHRGLIITNWHVVENEKIVGVLFKPIDIIGKISFSKKDVFFARVLKTDPVRDLALLGLVNLPSNLSPVQFGHLSTVEVGQDVFAISHPERLLWSYTVGVISQIRPKEEWRSDIGTIHKATLIQTQAVISFGSSGAPLFDANGRFIGVLVSTIGPGLNFAIAIDEVQQFILGALEKR